MSLSVQHLSFSYGPRRILEDVTFEVAPGAFCALLGPNGSGKSTLVKAIAGVHRAKSGTVTVEGRETSSLGRRELARVVGYVPQAGDAPFDLTVREAVMLGRTPHFGIAPRAEDRAKVEDAIARMGFGDLAERSMSELSGGQAQRALIARALAQDTRVLLLDEPTSALDLRYQIETLQLVRQITREERISALIAIHDLNHAARYCDQIVVLHGGRLVADGSPAEALRAPVLRSVYEVDVEVDAREDAVEVRPRVDAAGFTRTGARLAELDEHGGIRADAVAAVPR
ncbi:ABC transporter ATP-binding protein [Brachybacterium paraconglomeratum]|uniref:ABC transporter ATP-binding protein n=1 Tax=Brachybacterium paraconglomeratum TaxID=173362 RepID=UPI0021A768D9|nr:ABC transporter ATP-binding protein [Brachybacterium paraconglomeratum]MCT1907831.1 ABC transporter ATP-binding protein [Brachybacterium paraconglomeratum]